MISPESISLISSIATSIAAAAACISSLFSYKSTRLARQQLLTNSVNQCNERYCHLIKLITVSITQKNKEDFITNCYDLFELFCHQFILWKNNMLPDEIFFTWAYYNSRQLAMYVFIGEDATEITIYELWKQAKEENKFYQGSHFITYMKYVFDKDIDLIRRLKDKHINVQNMDYRI